MDKVQPKVFIMKQLKNAFAETLVVLKMIFAMPIAETNLLKLIWCQIAKYACKLEITDNATTNPNLVIKYP